MNFASSSRRMEHDGPPIASQPVLDMDVNTDGSFRPRLCENAKVAFLLGEI